VESSSLRNKVAAILAFLSGTLFILSGYQANVDIYKIVQEELRTHTARDFWQIEAIPFTILAVIAQIGGLVVVSGAILFVKNRITSGKVLVMLGTGQGIITILFTLILGLVEGGFDYVSNYVVSLTSSAIGIGILFSIVARSIAKPKSSPPQTTQADSR
jgi:hypothetical protein